MADINALKKRLEQLESTNHRVNNLWKPSSGKTQIRLVPYKMDHDNPFIELLFHYDLGGKNYLSPLSFQRPDPIEEFSKKLRASGDSEGWKLSKKLSAKMRTYVPIVVRGEEDQGVKFWGFGKTVYQELLGFMSDPDYGDITDPTSGRDVVVEFKTAEEVGASFPKTNIRVKPNVTPLTANKAQLDNFLENQKDVREIYQELSYDDLAEALNDYLSPDAEEESDTAGDGMTKSQMQEHVETASIDNFDDIFNKKN